MNFIELSTGMCGTPFCAKIADFGNILHFCIIASFKMNKCPASLHVEYADMSSTFYSYENFITLSWVLTLFFFF